MFPINLEIQHSIYTFDTAAFYTDEETALDHKLQELRKRINDDKRLRKEIESREQDELKQQAKARGEIYSPPAPPDVPDARARLKKGTSPRKKSSYKDVPTEELLKKLLSASDIKEINKEIRNVKQQLKETIDANTDIDRHVRPEAIAPYNIISIFDSCLTRCLQLSTTDVNDELVVVKVYYFGVAENIIKRGFFMNGEHYVFFSASAGQIRTKKFVAIKESAYAAIENTLTCGLPVEQINAHGGININKYLAYLALCNSATTPWPEFPVERTIVVEDFETAVPGLVDHIDPNTYTITRENMEVPITHTDGCGMILPSLSRKNFMLRAPWVKGLLAVFPFNKFIREMDDAHPLVNHALITDIYGVEHDVLKERIQIILTKSQFKLYKMYNSWSEYQQKFRKYGCVAGKCNEEPDRIDNAKFNYQMLQTLTDLSDEELEKICEKTNLKLRNMASDRQTMLQVFGATKKSDRLNAFQKSLAYYPELLQDPYCRETLRDLKNSIEWQAVAGRLDIDGKYLFLIPDLYAACQHWFCHEDVPAGLLKNGEVATRVYGKKDKLDVLRSPHLYKEHAVRRNVWADSPEVQKWFKTDAIYTSSFDTISKILQFDCDGDKSLVCADATIIAAAERNCADVVPLYYPMAKAGAVQVTPEAKYDGMVAAWTGGNIGEISNKISKIWASPAPDLDAVKILVMENNFVIDYAKTLYKPIRPPEWDERINAAASGRVPRFFIYAKDKTPHQCEATNQSCVNRLFDKIQSYKFDFKKKQLGTFDYKKLMHDPHVRMGEKEGALVDKYLQMVNKVGQYKMDIQLEGNPYAEAAKQIKKEMSAFGSEVYVTDVLVYYLFGIKKATHKAMLWDCFGDVIYANLTENHAGSQKMCSRCGGRFTPMYPHQCLCSDCSKEVQKVPEEIPDAYCVDCGRLFAPSSLHQTRCTVCQWILDNASVLPTSGEQGAICEVCGNRFSVRNSGRGRKSKMCGHCRDILKKEAIRERVRKHRSKLR